MKLKLMQKCLQTECKWNAECPLAPALNCNDATAIEHIHAQCLILISRENLAAPLWCLVRHLKMPEIMMGMSFSYVVECYSKGSMLREEHEIYCTDILVGLLYQPHQQHVIICFIIWPFKNHHTIQSVISEWYSFPPKPGIKVLKSWIWAGIIFVCAGLQLWVLVWRWQTAYSHLKYLCNCPILAVSFSFRRWTLLWSSFTCRTMVLATSGQSH